MAKEAEEARRANANKPTFVDLSFDDSVASQAEEDDPGKPQQKSPVMPSIHASPRFTVEELRKEQKATLTSNPVLQPYSPTVRIALVETIVDGAVADSNDENCCVIEYNDDD